MDYLIAGLVGALVGSVVTVVTMCLLAVNGEDKTE